MPVVRSAVDYGSCTGAEGEVCSTIGVVWPCSVLWVALVVLGLPVYAVWSCFDHAIEWASVSDGESVLYPADLEVSTGYIEEPSCDVELLFWLCMKESHVLAKKVVLVVREWAEAVGSADDH